MGVRAGFGPDLPGFRGSGLIRLDFGPGVLKFWGFGPDLPGFQGFWPGLSGLCGSGLWAGFSLKSTRTELPAADQQRLRAEGPSLLYFSFSLNGVSAFLKPEFVTIWSPCMLLCAVIKLFHFYKHLC